MKKKSFWKKLLLLVAIILFYITSYNLNIIGQYLIGLPLPFIFKFEAQNKPYRAPLVEYELDKYLIKRHLVHLKNGIKNRSKIIDRPVATSGCDKTLVIKPGTSRNIAIKVNNTQRIYRIYLPKKYSNSKKHPLILDFHGYASNGIRQEAISKFIPIANKHKIILVFPEGSFGKNHVQGWNTGLHKTIVSNDVLFVSDAISQLQSNFCVDPKRIYATGFSNGGGMVSRLMCLMGKRIAAFAPVSASFVTSPGTCLNEKPVSIINFHGTADRIVPYYGNFVKKEMSSFAWISSWARHDRCSKKPKIVYKSGRIVGYTFKRCYDHVSVLHYKIIGGRHTWPNAKFKEKKNGKTYFVNVSAIIWNFFNSHFLMLSKM